MNDPQITPQDWSYVFAVIRRIVRDDDTTADLTQDALLLAHRHRDQFRGDAAYRTWLYRIAVTTALGYLRKQRRSREQLVGDDHPVVWSATDPRPSPEQEATARELQARVEEALVSIGSGYREVFQMRMDDVPEVEIARRVGISVANVKIRTHRTRERLRAALPEYAVSPRVRAASRRPRGSQAGSTATSPAS